VNDSTDESVHVPWLMSFSSFFAGSDDPNNPIVVYDMICVVVDM
jgi:hypothetical protein